MIHAARCGRMFELLISTPKEALTKIDQYGQPLMCIACDHDETRALKFLLINGYSPDVFRRPWHPPIWCCLYRETPRSLEILLAAGAKTRYLGNSVFRFIVGHGDCTKILLANLVVCPFPLSDDLAAFLRSVHQCRSAAVAFLRVKRAGNLWRWDKFLLREIALAVWATRMNFF